MNQRVIKKVILAVIVALWLAGTAGGLQVGVDDIKAKINNERISLSLKEAPLVKILDVYRKLLGVEVRIRCEQERRVTIAFENITVRTSLNAICESAGLRWSLEASEPPVLLIECQNMPISEAKREVSMAGSDLKTASGENRIKVFKPEKESADRLELVVSIRLKDAELEKVLNMAAKLLDAQMVLDVKLGGKTVTLEMEKSTLRQFLDAVCAQIQAKWQVTKKDPPTLMVEKAI